MKKKHSLRKLRARTNLNKLKGNDAPEWVYRPLRLTIDELKDPMPVIEHFFKQYPLIDLRARHSDWLFLLASHCVHATADFMIFAEEMQRFAEAVFQLTGAPGITPSAPATRHKKKPPRP